MKQYLPFKNKVGCHADKRYEPLENADEICWYHFQDSILHASDSSENNTNDVPLTSALKLFATLMVNFDYEKNIKSPYFLGIPMKCYNFRSEVYLQNGKTKYRNHILVFIKFILFQNVIIL